jgi:hypothetical protein
MASPAEARLRWERKLGLPDEKILAESAAKFCGTAAEVEPSSTM